MSYLTKLQSQRLFILGIGTLVGFVGLAIQNNISAPVLIAVVVGVVVAGVVIARPMIGLFLLIPSILLSPTFTVGQLPFRPIELRFEDVLLLFLAVSIIVDIGRDRQGRLYLPSLTIPVFFVIATSFVAFLNGVLFHDINVLQSLLYMLKSVEYISIFLAVVAIVRTDRQFYQLLVIFLIVVSIISLSGVMDALLHYSTSMNLTYGRGSRARFTGLFVGPTVYGAFNALVLPMAVAITFQKRHRQLRLLAFVVAVGSTFALLLSAARGAFIGAWFGLSTLIFTIILQNRGPLPRDKLLLSFGFISGLSLLTIVLGSALGVGFLDRFLTLFVSPLDQPGIRDRVAKWLRFLLRDFIQNPILGTGIANAPWYNSYYVRLLVEQGLLSFIVFLWFISTLLKQLINIGRDSGEFLSYFTLGVLGSTISFLVVNIPAEMFIVARTVQPFWFLVGLAAIAPLVEQTSGSSGECHN